MVTEPLRFAVGDKVLANVENGFQSGSVLKVSRSLCSSSRIVDAPQLWDDGNPYRIRLDDGTEVWGPEDVDEFVRKAP